MSFSLLTLRIFALAALPLTLVRADSCPASQPEHFCCEAFGHFSDNYAVWHGMCGLDFPNSTTVGSFCDEETTCLSGFFALCCETAATCGGVDGPLAINCFQVED